MKHTKSKLLDITTSMRYPAPYWPPFHYQGPLRNITCLSCQQQNETYIRPRGDLLQSSVGLTEPLLDSHPCQLGQVNKRDSPPSLPILVGLDSSHIFVRLISEDVEGNLS